MKAKLITVNGTEHTITPDNGRDFKLKELQKYVDGYIEIINLLENKIMIINEEGKFSKEMNVKATELARSQHAIYDNDYIAGDVIICDSNQVK